MAKQTINIGTAANDKTGDPLRTAFSKANANFTELYDRTSFTGNYNDLSNKPTLFTGNYNDLSNKPTLFSGSYNDLTNKPTTSLNALVNAAESATLDAQGNILLDGSGPGAVNRGIVWKYGELYQGVNSKIYQSQDGLYVQPYSLGGTTYTWHFDGIAGKLRLPLGSAIFETSTTVVIEPPNASAGQSLVVRPTVSVWSVTSSGNIVYGSPITISINLGSFPYFGTVNYEITGTGVTQQSLGRALTGSVVFTGISQADTKEVTWTIPANSTITEFTFTLTGVQGTQSTNTQTQNDPALYYSFEYNGLPTGYFVTVNNNGATNNETSHIHLVTGNPVTTDLYLGDDNQYVKIEKNGGDVVIGTNLDNKRWRFGTDGKLTLPGAVVNSAIANTATLGGAATVISVTNSPNSNWTNGTGAAVGDLNFVVAVNAGVATVTTINSGGSGHTVGETVGPIPGSAFGGTNGIDDMTFEITAISAPVNRALDLTKSINKITPLTVGSSEQYTLADGVEGQIMYIVPASAIAENEYTSMSFAHARWTDGNGSITELSNANWWFPFRASRSTGAIVTLIFTDGHWNLPHNYFE